MRKLTTTAIATLLAISASQSTHAAVIIDTFDTPSVNVKDADASFSPSFSGGRMRIIRDGASNFGPIDYYKNASTYLSNFSPWQRGDEGFSLIPADEQYLLTLTDIQAVGANAPNWAIYAFYFDANNALTAEGSVQGDTSTTGTFSWDMRNQAAVLASAATEVRYTLRIWTIASGAGEGISYDSISFTAVPEPSSAIAICAVGAIALRRRASIV
jgi:hypothetical protein